MIDVSEVKGEIPKKMMELKTILEWKIVSKFIPGDFYRVTIDYTKVASKTENIVTLGSFKTDEVKDRILEFFEDKILTIESFGLLIESRTNDDVKNLEISFSKE